VFCAPEITHTTGIRSHTETSAPAAEGFDQQQTEAPAAEAPATPAAE
jgi:hypothetical protein